MKIKLDWEIFNLRFYLENTLYVKEFEDMWLFVTSDGPLKIYCEKMKSEGDEQNIMFVDKYLTDKENIIKVLSIEGFEEVEEVETEEPEEEFVEKLE